MKKFIIAEIWIISAILYPLSWVTYSGPNLSFLAWIALVPLLIFLSQNTTNFRKFYGAALAVTTCWTLTTSGWLFHFPTPKWQVALTIFSETMHISVPFIFLYLIQRTIGFSKALMMLPFLWVGWEWLYIPLQHTMGTHLLPYAQGNNLWLIQMADLGGMWLISFWVMLFNVSMYFVLSANNFQFISKSFAIAASKVGGVLILVPLLYSGYITQTSEADSEKSLQVSLVPTQFEPGYLMDPLNQKQIIETTLHRTDSLAYELINRNNGSDLYVWPEAGTSYWMAFDNLSAILHEATTDWSGALLTGCQGVPVDGSDQNAYVSGVMISPAHDSTIVPLQYHHKTALVPGTETIPYEDVLLPLIAKPDQTIRLTTPGESYEPLQLITRENENYQAGISLCYEQWFPSVWANQAKKGAEFFVHMAAEGWYGDIGYAQYMANVSRFRAIETRRSVVRSSNKGLSMFINSYGQTYQGLAYGSLNMATADVATSRKLTLFSQYPNMFPLMCLTLFIVSLLVCAFVPKLEPLYRLLKKLNFEIRTYQYNQP